MEYASVAFANLSQMRTKEKLQHAHELANRNLGKILQGYKYYYESKAIRAPYKAGDRVWLYQPCVRKGISRKLSRQGSCTIVKALSDAVYRFQKDRRGQESSGCPLQQVETLSYRYEQRSIPKHEAACCLAFEETRARYSTLVWGRVKRRRRMEYTQSSNGDTQSSITTYHGRIPRGPLQPTMVGSFPYGSRSSAPPHLDESLTAQGSLQGGSNSEFDGDSRPSEPRQEGRPTRNCLTRNI